MFGSSVLELAIGLTFCYGTVALIVATVQEALAAAFRLRANTLLAGIKSMLNDPRFEALAQAVYAHPLVNPHSDGSLVTETALAARPSYIEPAQFAIALIDSIQQAPGDFARLGADIDAVADPQVRRALRALHARRVLPAGSTLVLVGDLDPAAASDAVAEALAGWAATGHAVEAPAAPTAVVPGIELVDRPGAVQSTIRLGGIAPGRTDAELPAVRLANMIFGGYFSSRLVENIRERRGYTYSPRSSVDHQAAGSSFVVEADVTTEVTGPALLETWYELGRMALTAVTDSELDGARRYILGSMALSTATHAGLASTLSALIGAGLPAEWLAEHQQALGAVTVEQVQDVSLRYLAAEALTAVVVGDSGRITGPLQALAPISVTTDQDPA